MNAQEALASQLMGGHQLHIDTGGAFQIVGVWRGEFDLQTGRTQFTVSPHQVLGETVNHVILEYYRARLYVVYLEKMPSGKMKARIRLAGYIFLSFGNFPNGSNRKPVKVKVKNRGHGEKINLFTTGEAGVRTSDRPNAMLTPIVDTRVKDVVKDMYLSPGNHDDYSEEPLYVIGTAYSESSNL